MFARLVAAGLVVCGLAFSALAQTSIGRTRPMPRNYPDTGVLGVTPAIFGGEERQGVMLAAIAPGGPAAAAGLVGYELLLEINGTRVPQPEDFRYLLARHMPHARIALLVATDLSPQSRLPVSPCPDWVKKRNRCAEVVVTLAAPTEEERQARRRYLQMQRLGFIPRRFKAGEPGSPVYPGTLILGSDADRKNVPLLAEIVEMEGIASPTDDQILAQIEKADRDGKRQLRFVFRAREHLPRQEFVLELAPPG